MAEIDSTLYDAFGQRQVSTIYSDFNQYHVVMEVAPQYWQNPEMLRDIYVSTSGGAVSGTPPPASPPLRRPPRQHPRRTREPLQDHISTGDVGSPASTDQ